MFTDEMQSCQKLMSHIPVYTPVSNSIAVPLLNGLETLVSWPDIAAEVPVSKRCLQCFVTSMEAIKCAIVGTNEQKKLTKGFYKKTPRAPSPRTVTSEGQDTAYRSGKPATQRRLKSQSVASVRVEVKCTHTRYELRGFIWHPAYSKFSPAVLTVMHMTYGFGAIHCCLHTSEFVRRTEGMRYAVPVGRVYAGCTLCGKYTVPRLRHCMAKASPVMSR